MYLYSNMCMAENYSVAIELLRCRIVGVVGIRKLSGRQIDNTYDNIKIPICFWDILVMLWK